MTGMGSNEFIHERIGKNKEGFRKRKFFIIGSNDRSGHLYFGGMIVA